jgi:hypothetical protein
MGPQQTLGIEKALAGAGGSFIAKYRLMKERLLNVEYEHWAAGFPEGNNHGRQHITRVLEYLNRLLATKPLKHLNPYELFLAMMSILYHDIGLIQQRERHADISKSLLEGDSNDAYIINSIDKEIIAAAVVSHSSSKDIAAECAQFPREIVVGNYEARPKVVAALVRLADELDEDHRRADPILQQRLENKLPPDSRFFWLFCQRVRGVRPNLTKKWIEFQLALEPQDTKDYGPVPGGRTRPFVVFAAEKLAKINQERVYVNNFLPEELQYATLHVELTLRNHPKWTTPQTFVFNDTTTAQRFLQSYPELLAEPANEAMEDILQLMGQGDLVKADQELHRLASVLADLPIDSQMRIVYNEACIHSMRAATFSDSSQEYEQALDEAARCLVEWFERGQKGAFKAMGRTAKSEVYRMAADGDLAVVLSKRGTKLQKAIPRKHWPPREHWARRGSGGGCVPLGTYIDTPDGKCLVERLRPGDDVVSLRLGSAHERVRATVVAVATTRSMRCIQINKSWLVTPTQPVRTSTGWVEAAALKEGDRVMDGYGTLVPIVDSEVVERAFEVFDLTITAPCHNYVANGLLCHNKMFMI